MSSPLHGNEPDTPISSSSPSPVDDKTSTSVPQLISPSNDVTPSIDKREPLPDVNGRSCSSSPVTITPTLLPSSPANGILTPPTDGDNVSETGKPDKAGGRLKFFKDGILCLELSHHNEGERTKWVQIRTKTVFPTVVHTTKEATIPCHVSPTSFNSPSASNLVQARIESSTSHSMSDDGSSMLSSPRLRENTWKQSVPQKGVSSCLEFFMMPAVCVFKIRRLVVQNSKTKTGKFYRKPYCCQTSFVSKLSEKLSCECSASNGCKLEKNYSSSSKEGCAEAEIQLNSNCKPDIKSRIKTNYSSRSKSKACTRKGSLLKIVDRLKAERKIKHHENTENILDKEIKQSVGKGPSVLPKKRIFQEYDSKDLLSASVHTKKKSPNRNQDTKTILNVPGLNSEYYRRHSNTLDNNLSKLSTTQHSILSNDTKSTGKISQRGSKNGLISARKNNSSSPYSIGAKPPSPTRTKKVTLPTSAEVSKDSKVVNNPNPYAIRSAMCLNSLPPQEQEIFQRQTMSKAISYTINSLLGNPGSSETPGKNMSSSDPQTCAKKGTRGSASSKKSFSVSQLQKEFSHGMFGSKNDQDQNSFLRHLLDTSDPIPNAKPEKANCKQKSSSSPTNSRRNSKVATALSNSSVANDLRKASSPSKPVVSNSAKATVPSNPPIGAYPSTIHPSLVNNNFPLSISSAYDSFLRSQEASSPNALAAAAAAAFQYGSLLPGNLYSNFNTVAAAMAASYLNGFQNSPRPVSSASTLSSRSPSVPSISPLNYSTGSSPLNLSQHAWAGSANGLTPGSGTIPLPFQAPNSDNLHSRSRSSVCQNYTRERLEKVNEIIDNDAPLNLSKKPRSN